MAELPTGFWSGWVLTLTLVSLAALTWLVLSVYLGKHNGEAAHGDADAEPIWDGDLREGNNLPPLWWFWMLLASLVFSLIYLMLFPGLGSYEGMLNWSQGSRLEESYDQFNNDYDSFRTDVAARDVSDIQNEPELMSIAARVFDRECATCHGEEGRGQAGMFPNLQDVDWQWGGSAQDIETTIRAGRNANMLSWSAILDESAIRRVSEYVLTLSDAPGADAPGRASYEQYCAACHGVEGQGTPALGAPRLSDNIWLYGGSLAEVEKTLRDGRQGHMPGFAGRLDDMQIKLLVAYLAR